MKKLLAILFTTAMLFAGAGVANATDNNAESSAPQPGVFAYSSTLTITDDATGAVVEKTEHHSSILANTAKTASAAASGGDLAVHCNQYYAPTDANGTFTIQHACKGTTAPWSFRASAAACSGAVTTAFEPGMSWEYNGIRQGEQKDHTEACRYTFHGTFNPATDYSLITYQDSLTYKVLINGKSGTALIQIAGKLNLLGSTCSPTNC